MTPPTSATIARIVVDLSIGRAFDYRIPESLRGQVRIGSMVGISFNHAMRKGYVIALTDTSAVNTLKDIDSVIGDQEMLPPALITLGKWIADYYCCTLEQAIKTMLPAAVRNNINSHNTQKIVHLIDNINLADILLEKEKKAPKQAAAIKKLVLTHTQPLTQWVKSTGISYSAVKSLLKSEVIGIDETQEDIDLFSGLDILPTAPLTLNPEQLAALNMIQDRLKEKINHVFLLMGVTGSGKTEVYLQAIQRCIEANQEAIVLVPEISLTPQTIERFRGRFGEHVSVLHSHLSNKERVSEWNKVNEGKVKIVVGARSAVFAPFRNLGLIVVDEEHETSYKQDQTPRYQARDVAVMRGKIESCTVILGTATPALESYHNTQIGKYTLIELKERIDQQIMPTIEIVDLAVEAADCGQPQILSRRLITMIKATLTANEQTILFLNRRGFATHLQCLQCGYQAQCLDCSRNFTYHRRQERLICHLCGALRSAPVVCPQCSDKNIRYGGIGTEKIENAIKSILPQARVARMDSDTMTRKHSYRDVLMAFRAGEINILIGTQMIAKGLHFPNVTLVGIVFADQTLNLPDFRAGERTFQLLVQVAGRAGRGDLPGHVIIQTYTPFHPVLTAAIQYDYPMLYNQEIPDRLALNLPPCKRLLLLVLKGEDEMMVQTEAEQMYNMLAKALPKTTACAPPVPSPISKKRGMYHYQILLTTDSMPVLTKQIKPLLNAFRPAKGLYLNVDIDPQSLW